MINVFNEIFDGLSDALTSHDASIETASAYTNMPSNYPFVSMEEISDSVYEQGMDCCEIENFANKDYEINIYANGDTKKAKADGIAEVVDTFFKSLGFVRTFKNPIQSGDETIYRIVIRYNGVVSKDHTIYRR